VNAMNGRAFAEGIAKPTRGTILFAATEPRDWEMQSGLPRKHSAST